MKDKKNIIITIIIIVVLVALIVIASLVGQGDTKTSQERTAEIVVENAQKESAAVQDDEKKAFTFISVDDYLNLLNSTENQFIVVARPTCHYCQIAEPIIQNIMFENQIDLNYLNTDDFEGEDQNKFVSSSEAFTNGFGTPMVLCVKDGKIVDMVNGLMDKYGYEEFFKAYGLLK